MKGTKALLTDSGPIIEISIARPSSYTRASKDEGKEQFKFNARALIDTGATMSVISKKLAESLGLHPIRTQLANTASSQNISYPVYRVNIHFSGGKVLESSVLSAPLSGLGVDCLIGRDILKNAVLVYNGLHNCFQFSIEAI